MKILETMGGETSESVLTLEIASAHGIDRQMVQRTLAKNDDLTFLRPEKGKWKIPKREYDL